MDKATPPCDPLVGATVSYPTAHTIGTTRMAIPAWSPPVRVLAVTRFDGGGALIRYAPLGRERTPDDLVLLPGAEVDRLRLDAADGPAGVPAAADQRAGGLR
jgi:hypothetical protein